MLTVVDLYHLETYLKARHIDSQNICNELRNNYTGCPKKIFLSGTGEVKIFLDTP